jgi:hypothetical protein
MHRFTALGLSGIGSSSVTSHDPLTMLFPVVHEPSVSMNGLAMRAQNNSSTHHPIVPIPRPFVAVAQWVK